jgi:8-oxo-dGTP diphosphatase
MSEPRREDHQLSTSAGGVVWRATSDGVEIVLCGRDGDNAWMLPKGTPLPEESIHETALREVREETGLGVVITGDLGTIEYEFTDSAGVHHHKTVYHFLMTPDGTGATEHHDAEYDRVSWFPVRQALRLLKYSNQRDVVRRAMDIIREGVPA